MELKRNKVFVQIGTNNGSDNFRMLVEKYHPSKVVLVEPNGVLNGDILISYAGIPVEISIENVAITEINKGEVRLVIPDEENRRGQIYHNGHFSLLPMM